MYFPSLKSALPALAWLTLFGMLTVLSGCSSARFLGEDETVLSSVRVTSDTKAVKPSQYRAHVRQEPNSRWFNLVKVPLGIYCLSGTDTTKRINRFVRKLGEAPVVYDSAMTAYAMNSLRVALMDKGYLHAAVDTLLTRKGHKTSLTYHLRPGALYYVDSVGYTFDSPEIANAVRRRQGRSLLYKGMPLESAVLEAERSRIVRQLQDEGYYYVHKEFITYTADTCAGEKGVGLTLHFACPPDADPARAYRTYRLREVTVRDAVNDTATAREGTYRGLRFLTDDGRTTLYRRVLRNHIAVRPDSLYRERDVQDTYSSLNSLQIVKYSTLRTTDVSTPDSGLLDCDVYLDYNQPHTLSAELEGTNTAGDLGAAVALTYANRNIFRGAEVFSVKLRGAYEAITGLEGYSASNYMEYSAEASLLFPSFMLPVSAASRMDVRGSSEFSLMYNSQDRPEFHRRVLTGAWYYQWFRHSDRRWRHRLNLLSLNYVFMPWISDTFRRDYLDSNDPHNAILRYSYENLFIMKWGYQLVYNSARAGAGTRSDLYQTNAYQFRFNIESAGNLLYAASKLFHASRGNDGQYTLFNIAYSQYVKADFDFARSVLINDRNSVAFHVGLGIAIPYGNSTIIPYEQRYFSGGANSVRGWSVRELGPGSFVGKDGNVDFINHTGNFKLDLNVEYRTHLFWKFDGAVFIDAGNVWNTRNYAGQEGGKFRFDTFYKQIAVAYGLGLRLNFDYFILRFDGGMKAVNPVYTTRREHFPIVHPRFSRDFTFHFAVGLPF